MTAELCVVGGSCEIFLKQDVCLWRRYPYQGQNLAQCPSSMQDPKLEEVQQEKLML